MSTKENEALVRRYFDEVWNKGNLEVTDEIIAHSYGSRDGVMCGLTALKLSISAYRETFPNTCFTILSMTAEGDTVAVCWASQGTYAGLRSAYETGKGTAQTGMSIYRIAEGKIVEGWAASDELGAMQRLGARTED